MQSMINKGFAFVAAGREKIDWKIRLGFNLRVIG